MLITKQELQQLDKYLHKLVSFSRTQSVSWHYSIVDCFCEFQQNTERLCIALVQIICLPHLFLKSYLYQFRFNIGSMKKIYVLFSIIQPFSPKIYKTKRVVKQYVEKNQILDFKQFVLPEQAKMFIEKLQKNNTLLKSKLIALDNKQKQSVDQDQPFSQKESNVTTEQENQLKSNVQQYQSSVNIKYNQLKQLQAYQKVLSRFRPSQPLFKVMPILQYKAFFDGCSKKNPGKSSIGYYAIDTRGRTVLRNCQYVGFKTNNQAEFLAFVWCLADAYCNGIKHLKVFGDCQLVCKSMNGNYTIKNVGLQACYQLGKILVKKFPKIQIQHIPRIYNGEADKLANKGLKKASYLNF